MFLKLSTVIERLHGVVLNKEDQGHEIKVAGSELAKVPNVEFILGLSDSN